MPDRLDLFVVGFVVEPIMPLRVDMISLRVEEGGRFCLCNCSHKLDLFQTISVQLV